MTRPRLVLAAAMLAGTMMPAAAADWPMRRVYRAPPPAVVAAPAVQPFYLVNQGPEYSGPGIHIVEIGFTDTNLRRNYPFIGRSDGIPVRFRPGDFYGITPDQIETGSIPRR
jgi:hypothetical protein